MIVCFYFFFFRKKNSIFDLIAEDENFNCREKLIEKYVSMFVLLFLSKLEIWSVVMTSLITICLYHMCLMFILAFNSISIKLYCLSNI